MKTWNTLTIESGFHGGTIDSELLFIENGDSTMKTKRYISPCNKDMKVLMENFRRFSIKETGNFGRDSKLLLFKENRIIGSTSLLEEIKTVREVHEWNNLYRRWEKSAHIVWNGRQQILEEGVMDFLKGLGKTAKEFAKDPIGELGRQLYMLGQKAMQMGRKAVKGGLVKKLIGGVQKLLTMKGKFAKKYPKINSSLNLVAATVTLMGLAALTSGDAAAADLVINSADPAQAVDGVKELIASEEDLKRILELVEKQKSGLSQQGYDVDKISNNIQNIIKMKGELNLSNVADAVTNDPNALKAKEFLNAKDGLGDVTNYLSEVGEDTKKLIEDGADALDRLESMPGKDTADAAGGKSISQQIKAGNQAASDALDKKLGIN